MIKALKSIVKPSVKTLVYFSSPDLMVEMTYNQLRNALQYASHREMLFRERFGVENYLLRKFAVKTGYYKSQSAMLKYSGVNSSLLTELSRVHSLDTVTSIAASDAQVEDAVQTLINQSLSNYYFEQIGNALLEIRRVSPATALDSWVDTQIARLQELVDAYNLHAEKEVSVDALLAEEWLRERMK